MLRTLMIELAAQSRNMAKLFSLIGLLHNPL